MSVKVRFFASLSEELGFSSMKIEYHPPLTIKDIWSGAARRPMPENLLCARNHEYAGFDQRVEDGDEVAFFPPVNGG